MIRSRSSSWMHPSSWPRLERRKRRRRRKMGILRFCAFLAHAQSRHRAQLEIPPNFLYIVPKTLYFNNILQPSKKGQRLFEKCRVT
jgi:hypothetical protein